jgi:hypothetical protein
LFNSHERERGTTQKDVLQNPDDISKNILTRDRSG